MPWNETAMCAAANGIRAIALYGQLHTDAAGEAYDENLADSGREAITWGTATGLGDFDLASQLDFTGGDPGGPIFSITFWSAATNGTCYGEFQLEGDLNFNGSGEYSVTAIDSFGFTNSGS